jgi:hypothetical protein
MKGLPDGSLLGNHNFKGNPDYNRKKTKNIALTGDEKRAIMGKTPNSVGGKSEEKVLREQRDQALLEISALKRDLRISEGKEKAIMGELTLFKKIVEDQNEELKILKSITVWKLIRKKLSDWLAP